ncbi:branched-chain amino acid aminotransferase [Lentzea sp. JNUCC 0626]|uniref:branched-chain amino acid aminotransferase n=1 Tax=Lentzea sp. JNUCC 0626 TaxID=3367513 RepID=UPI00374859EA
MTSTLSFRRYLNPRVATPAQVAEVLANPGFGKHTTDHMVTISFDPENGWHDAQVRPFAPLALSPCASVLHYGQAIFEGLKAFRQPDGSVACFRPDANARRFAASAARLAMPELPAELFLSSLTELVALDERWVPEGTGKSLYLRPLMIATSADLVVTAGTRYEYVLVALPTGSYFTGGVKPITAWLSREYVRASPDGTGSAKCAANYAGTLLAQAQAAENGCSQVVWLDAVDRHWVEEMTSMNLFFVFGSGPGARVVTPELSGSLLPGVTRDAIIRIAAELGLDVEERRVSADEWRDTAASGALTEVFACGTAAVVTPVGTVKSADGEIVVNGGRPGSLTMELRRRLVAIQEGVEPDVHGWMHTIA